MEQMPTLMYSPYSMILSLSISSVTIVWRYHPSAARMQFQQPACQSCVEKEFPKCHFGETGRNGDEMADAGDEPACDGSRHAVVIEIVFTFLHLFLIQHTEMSPTAVGETIDNRSAKIVARQIVDRARPQSAPRWRRK